MDSSGAAAEARSTGRRIDRETAPWIEWLARAGYAAKGLVYMLVGGLALQVALGGGDTEGSGDALQTLADGTFGRIALGVVAVGLFGYVAWRLVGAVRNPEHDSGARRAFYLVTAFIYGGLALQAARLALGSGGSSGGSGADETSATLMSQPFGQWLVAAAGVAVGLYGLHQIWKAFTADLDDRLDLSDLDADKRRGVVRLGRAGLAARGVVFVIMAGFFISAALHANPSEARGLGGALSSLRGQSYGQVLLGLVAAGLMAYGVYNLVRARYRRITVR